MSEELREEIRRAQIAYAKRLMEKGKCHLILKPKDFAKAEKLLPTFDEWIEETEAETGRKRIYIQYPFHTAEKAEEILSEKGIKSKVVCEIPIEEIMAGRVLRTKKKEQKP